MDSKEGIIKKKDFWTAKETYKFLSIWREHRHQIKKTGPKRELFEELSAKMAEEGFRKSKEQVCKKVQNMKMLYKKYKPRTIGGGPSNWQYYSQVHEILKSGHSVSLVPNVESKINHIGPDIKGCHLGFIGAGNIAFALIQGLLKSDKIRAKQMSVSAPSDRNLKKFQELGCFTTNSNNQIFGHLANDSNPKKSTKVVFLCIKPNIFNNDFKLSLNHSIAKEETLVVVSVMAGITLKQLDEQMSGSSLTEGPVKYVRLIPNTAVTVGAGFCGISIVEYLWSDQLLKDFLTKLLTPIGLCEFVAEQQMNAICGLGGSGIAFVYSLIHAMSDGGLKMGLSRNMSTNIAAQTVLGAALMVLKTEKNPIVLRDEVASPGGTTIHGLHALEKGAFNSVIIDAIEAATERANQLS